MMDVVGPPCQVTEMKEKLWSFGQKTLTLQIEFNYIYII